MKKKQNTVPLKLHRSLQMGIKPDYYFATTKLFTYLSQQCSRVHAVLVEQTLSKK